MALVHILDRQTDQIIGTLDAGEYNGVRRSSLDNKNQFDFVAFRHFDILQKRNRVLVRDADGFFHEYIITFVEQQSRYQKRVMSDASFIDLAKAKVIEPRTLEGQTSVTIAPFILSGTEWQVGEVDHTITANVVIENYTNPYDLLKKVAEIFGLEIRFRVEIKGNKITGRYVDLKKPIDTFQGKEIEFGKDLIDITRKEDNSRIVTALLGVGPKREDGTYLTYLAADTDALQRWGRNGNHLVEVYQPDNIDENMTLDQLKELTEAELKKRIDSIVTYEGTAAAIEHIPGFSHENIRLGQTVRIKDVGYTPSLYVEARILELEEDPATRRILSFKLGNFVEYKKEDLEKQIKLLKELMAQKASSAAVQQALEYAEQKAAEAEQAAKQYADAQDVTVYEDATYYADQVSTSKANEAKQHADNVAQQAEQNARNYTNAYAEKAIHKGSTPPSNPAVGDLWIDTSVTPNLLKRWTGSAWQKLAPTTASEIGAVAKSEYDAKVQQLTNDIAAKADAQWVNGQLVLKANASDVYTKTETDNKLGTKADKATTYTKTEVDNALNSKVSVTQYTTDMNGVVTQLNDHESRITQTEQEIATKVSSTQYQQDKTALESDISSLETRMANAETAIVQNANAIQLKANASDVYTKSQVDTSLANKADKTKVDSLETRISNAEAQLTVQAGQIATKVSQTEFTQELAKKENSVVKSSTAPSNPTTNMLWLDTSVTPNVLKRWNGSAWVKATPTTAGEVGAYSKSETDSKLATKANQSDLNTLTTRVSTAETNITQLSNQITLKANASDVYTKQQIDTSLAGKADVSTVSAIEQRVSQAEAQLTVQAGEIATKVSQTELQTAIDGIQVGGRNYARELGGDNYNLIPRLYGTDENFAILEIINGKKWIRYTGSSMLRINSIPVEPNTTYTWSFNVYTTGTDTSIGIYHWDGGGYGNGNLTISKIPKRVSHTFTTRSNTTYEIFHIADLSPTDIYYFSDFKLEKGNKATDWTPAPEDVDGQISGLNTRLSTAESSITQLSNQITLKVNQSQYDIDMNNLTSRMSSAESQLTIQAGQIATKVEKNGVISAINQTPEQVKIQANKIALDRYVEAKHIKSLNGLNVNNQFIVDSNGNVKFAGNLEGANGTFNGNVEIIRGDAKTKIYENIYNEYKAPSIDYSYHFMVQNGTIYLWEKRMSTGQELSRTDIYPNFIMLSQQDDIDAVYLSNYEGKLNVQGGIRTEDFQNAALINGWGNYGSGYQPAQYMKDPFGYVHLRGSIRWGVNPSVAFILPAGYRPANKLWFTVSAGTMKFANIEIRPNGEVYVSTQDVNYVSLDDIVPFKAEQ
jgi:phage minor structural protein